MRYILYITVKNYKLCQSLSSKRCQISTIQARNKPKTPLANELITFAHYSSSIRFKDSIISRIAFFKGCNSIFYNPPNLFSINLKIMMSYDIT